METRKKRAHRWLVRQRRRKRIRVVGVVQRRDTGRPELLYGRPFPRGMEEHEVRVTDLALYFLKYPFSREAKVGRTHADAVMTLEGGRRCFIEVDNSENMTAKQMTAKWRRYEGTEGDILVVCVTEGRMQRLRAGAELVKDRALFTTFARLQSAMTEPWVDWFGNTVRL
jgi:hypothetical protein